MEIIDQDQKSILCDYSYSGTKNNETSGSKLGLKAGTYYMKVYSYSSECYRTTYTFTINYTPSSVWEKEFNEKIGKETAITTNTKWNGMIKNSSDRDWYSFKLNNYDTVSITFAHEYGKGDWYVDLVDKNQNSVLLSERIKSSNSSQTTKEIGLSAGIYYIKVYSYSSSAYREDYSLIVNTKKNTQTSSSIWKRLSGTGRYDTMKAIVNEGFTKTGGTVVIATGIGFKDALAASGLAGLDNAPVVLTDGKSLSLQAKDILTKLKPKKVYVAGGTAVVTANVLSQIKTATGVTPNRIAGANSSETSAKLALEGKGRWKDSTAVIATNKSFKDALSVAPIAYAKGYPILLADNGQSLSSAVLNALTSLGIKNVIIVGGTGAVSTNVESQLRSKGISLKKRLAGNNGVETSAAIAKWGLQNGMSANKMGVATSQNYPDALAGAALCGYNNSVLVLADDKATTNWSFPTAYKTKIKRAYVFGGTSAVGTKTWNALVNSVA